MMIFILSLYVVLGVLAGLLAGLLGIGGGAIVVPGLAAIFTHAHMPSTAIMHIAAGTSLAAMILTTIVAVITQQRHKTIIWPLFRQLAPGIAVGTIGGAYIASLLPTHALKFIFGVFLLVTAIRMFIGGKSDKPREAPGRVGQIASGLLIGVLSGLLGIGGGALTVPLLLRFGLEPHNATATSSACALLLAVVGTLSFMLTSLHTTLVMPVGSTGYVYWPAAAAVAIASMIFVPFGTKLARRLSGETLKRIFAVFLLLIAFDMLV